MGLRKKPLELKKGLTVGFYGQNEEMLLLGGITHLGREGLGQMTLAQILSNKSNLK
jgi:hypothetical protein